MAKPRSVPIELWQEMTEEDDVIEPRTLTLSDRDRDLFLEKLQRKNYRVLHAEYGRRGFHNVSTQYSKETPQIPRTDCSDRAISSR